MPSYVTSTFLGYTTFVVLCGVRTRIEAWKFVETALEMHTKETLQAGSMFPGVTSETHWAINYISQGKHNVENERTAHNQPFSGRREEK